MDRTTKLDNVMPLGLSYAGGAQLLGEATLSFAGDRRMEATFVCCGPGCTLNDANSDGGFAQPAATRTFTVSVLSAVRAISFSYGGGRKAADATVTECDFAPQLSSFGPAGSLVASTFDGLTCPAGAQLDTACGQCEGAQLPTPILSLGGDRIATGPAHVRPLTSVHDRRHVPVDLGQAIGIGFIDPAT